METEMYGYHHQDYSLSKCKFTLHKNELWKQFHNLETEMIITKSGRRMFPAIRIQVENLDPRAHYCVYLEMTLATKCRYKYTSALGWSPAGTEEAQSPRRLYIHPESPSTGEHWMSQPISFGKLKLTNTLNPQNGQVVLSSMHKYQPRIIIMKSIDPQAYAFAPSTSYAFPETQFIAVTAYQNDKITKLKIDNNPFAKGFRENGQAKCKRKRNVDATKEVLEDDEEEIDVLTTSSVSSSSDFETDSDSFKTPSPSTSTTNSGCVSSSYVPTNNCYSTTNNNYTMTNNRYGTTNNNYGPLTPPYYGRNYPDYFYPYYPNVPFGNTYFNYANLYVSNPYLYNNKPVNIQQVQKKPKYTDFSIRAITGIS